MPAFRGKGKSSDRTGRALRGQGPRPGDATRSSDRPQRRAGGISLCRLAGPEPAYELVHPRCVGEAELDYQEGMELWKAGDPEGARDALRYALQACHDNLWVHNALGRIALEEFRDASLARGHFGYAVELVRRDLPPDFSGPLPSARPANRPFHEALAGLILCLRSLGQSAQADDLARLVETLKGSRNQAPAPQREKASHDPSPRGPGGGPGRGRG